MRLRAVAAMSVVAGVSMAAWAGDIEGKVAGMKGKSVVYVDAIAGKTFPAPTDHPVIDQKGLTFTPSIVVVQQGTTVDFKNDDNVAHNVFWPSVGGDKRSYTFDKPGAVPLLCNVHPDMAGYLIVSPTPYFAQTDESGNYKIKDVPDGSYKLVVWHEGAKNQSKPVTVAGGGKADFTLSK